MIQNKIKDCEVHSKEISDYPDVINVQQLSQMLGGVSTKTCYRLLRSGQIETIKIGREYKIPKLKVLAFLKIN